MELMEPQRTIPQKTIDPIKFKQQQFDCGEVVIVTTTTTDEKKKNNKNLKESGTTGGSGGGDDDHGDGGGGGGHGISSDHPTSYLETLMHLFKGNVGPGLFAMGDAFKNAGIIAAPIMTLFLGIICVHSQHILVCFVFLNSIFHFFFEF